MDDLKRAKGLEFSSRTAALSLFGMMNWIYTWYKPRLDGDAEELAREMGDIFLQRLKRPAESGSCKAVQQLCRESIIVTSEARNLNSADIVQRFKGVSSWRRQRSRQPARPPRS